MSIVETKPQFRASDGRVFDTKAEAERHEWLEETRQEYEAARVKFGAALAETQRTADGQPFEFGYRTYWRIAPGWGGLPTLERVEFYAWRFNFDFDDRDRFTILERDDAGRVRHWRVDELYAHRSAAERALLAEQEAWLAERAAEVEETRNKLIPTPEGDAER